MSAAQAPSVLPPPSALSLASASPRKTLAAAGSATLSPARELNFSKSTASLASTVDYASSQLLAADKFPVTFKLPHKSTSSSVWGIWHAVFNGNEERVRELLEEKSVDIEAKDADGGRTPLHWATKASDFGMIKYLLGRGASMHAQDAAGNSVLHYAAAFSVPAVCLFYLEHGASKHVANQAGATPAEYALKLGRSDNAGIIERWAEPPPKPPPTPIEAHALAVATLDVPVANPSADLISHLQALKLKQERYGPADERLLPQLDKLATLYCTPGSTDYCPPAAEECMIRTIGILDAKAAELNEPPKPTPEEVESGKVPESRGLTNPAEAAKVSRQLAAALSRVAQFYTRHGRYQEAIKPLQAAGRLFELVSGPSSLDVVRTSWNMAKAMHAIDRFKEAAPHLQFVLAANKELWGEQSESVAETLFMLGRGYLELQQYEKAVTFLKDCTAVAEVALGTDSLLVAQACDKAAECYMAMYQSAAVPVTTAQRMEMERLLGRSLDIRLKQFPSTHPEVLRSRTNFGAASCLFSNGDAPKSRRVAPMSNAEINKSLRKSRAAKARATKASLAANPLSQPASSART